MNNLEPKITTQREAWDIVFGNSHECLRRREKLDSEMKVFLPDEYPPKIFFEYLYLKFLENGVFVDRGLSHLNDISPRAWRLILRYGKQYYPKSCIMGNPQKEGMTQPRKHKCCSNCWTVIYHNNQKYNHTDTTYIEGFSAGLTFKPMLHAWNGFGSSDVALDWTLYAFTSWARYFGVSFTQEEYRYITSSTEGGCNAYLLFGKGNFERVEDKILEVLKRRDV